MRRLLLPFTLLLLALPLAACGGTAQLSALDPVAQAANKTTDVAGARFELSARVTALGRRLAISGHGELADHGRKAHVLLTVPGSSSPIEAVAADSTVYVRGGPVDAVAHGKWVRVQANDPAFNLAQADPAKLLDTLRSSSKIQKRGSVTIRGVPTTHYVARVRLDKLAQNLSPGDRRALKQAGKRQIPVDVWVDAQGLVRRVKVDARPVAATLDLFDFGDVTVQVPPASDTTDLSSLMGGGG
jgi:hypothetical protein